MVVIAQLGGPRRCRPGDQAFASDPILPRSSRAWRPPAPEYPAAWMVALLRHVDAFAQGAGNQVEIKSASTSSMGLVRRKGREPAGRAHPRSKAACPVPPGRRYLFPISQPVKPASAISLMICRKVFSAPSSGMSSTARWVRCQKYLALVKHLGTSCKVAARACAAAILPISLPWPSCGPVLHLARITSMVTAMITGR